MTTASTQISELSDPNKLGYFSSIEKPEDRLEMFKYLFLKAVDQRQPKENRWLLNEKLYSGYIDPMTWPYNSSISVRRVWEFVNTEHSRLYAATTGAIPPFQVLPVSADDVERAPKIQQLMLWQWEAGMNFFEEWNRFILTGLIYGIAPMLIDWRVKYGWVPSQVPYKLKDGTKAGTIKKNNFEVLYDGAGCKALSSYEIYPYGNLSRIDDATLIFRRIKVHYDELMRYQKRGVLKNVEELFNKNDQLVTTDFSDRIATVLGQRNTDWDRFDHRGDIEVIEAWSRSENYYMIVGGGNVILAEGEIPYLNAQTPFVFWDNFTNLWDWCGWSDPELLEDLQHEANFKRNQRIDCVNMQLMPMFKRLRTANIYDDDLTFMPWGWIDTDDMNGLDQLDIKDTWTQSTFQEEQAIEADMEGILGLTDQRRGVQPAKRETKYAASIRNESSSVRTGHKTQNLFLCMKRLLTKQHHLNQQFLDKKTIVRVLEAEIPDFVDIEPADILKDYDFIIMPTGSFGNRAVRKEELMQLAQLFQAAPNLGAVTNWPVLAKMIFKEFDFRNADEMTISTEEAQSMAQQMGAGGGGAPAGTGETALAELASGAPAPQSKGAMAR